MRKSVTLRVYTTKDFALNFIIHRNTLLLQVTSFFDKKCANVEYQVNAKRRGVDGISVYTYTIWLEKERETTFFYLWLAESSRNGWKLISSNSALIFFNFIYGG